VRLDDSAVTARLSRWNPGAVEITVWDRSSWLLQQVCPRAHLIRSTRGARRQSPRHVEAKWRVPAAGAIIKEPRLTKFVQCSNLFRGAPL